MLTLTPLLGKEMTQNGGGFYGERSLKTYSMNTSRRFGTDKKAESAHLPRDGEMTKCCFQSRSSYRILHKETSISEQTKEFCVSLWVCSIISWTALNFSVSFQEHTQAWLHPSQRSSWETKGMAGSVLHPGSGPWWEIILRIGIWKDWTFAAICQNGTPRFARPSRHPKVHVTTQGHCSMSQSHLLPILLDTAILDLTRFCEIQSSASLTQLGKRDCRCVVTLISLRSTSFLPSPNGP